MAFERAHLASLSRLDFSTLAERSKALYFAKVNDLIRIASSELTFTGYDLDGDGEEDEGVQIDVEMDGDNLALLDELRLLEAELLEAELLEDELGHENVLERQEIVRLPCRTSAGGPEEDEKECAVCLSQFERGDLVRMLPCRHEFHADCIDKWLLEKDRRCPCCRTSARSRIVKMKEEELTGADIPLPLTRPNGV